MIIFCLFSLLSIVNDTTGYNGFYYYDKNNMEPSCQNWDRMRDSIYTCGDCIIDDITDIDTIDINGFFFNIWHENGRMIQVIYPFDQSYISNDSLEKVVDSVINKLKLNYPNSWDFYYLIDIGNDVISLQNELIFLEFNCNSDNLFDHIRNNVGITYYKDKFEIHAYQLSITKWIKIKVPIKKINYYHRKSHTSALTESMYYITPYYQFYDSLKTMDVLILPQPDKIWRKKSDLKTE